MPSNDDFFGTSIIGMDPYHEQKSQALDRYMAIDGLLAPRPDPNARTGGSRLGVPPVEGPTRRPLGEGGTTPGGIPYQTFVNRGTGRGSPPYLDPNMSDFANYNVYSGGGVNTLASRSSAAGDTPRDRVPSPADTVDGARTSPPATPTNPDPRSAVWHPNRFVGNDWLGGNVPPDLGPLREELTRYFLENGFKPPAEYGGGPVQMSPYAGMSANFAGQAPGAAQQWFQQGWDMIGGAMPTVDRVMNQQFQPDLRGLQGYGDELMRTAYQGGQNEFGGSINPALHELMSTGGAPNIQGALDAIKNQGMSQLDTTMADITEQYGAMGLGSSSDILKALGTGASRGIADIISQQSQLSAGINSAAQDRRLGATGMGIQAGNFMNQPFESMAARATNLMPTMQSMYESPARFGLQSNALNLQAANQRFQGGSIAGQYGQSIGNIYNDSAKTFMGLAGLDNQLNMGNRDFDYQNFLRMNSPSPWLNAALAYSTGFPPNKPVIPEGPSQTSQVISGISQFLPLLALL